MYFIISITGKDGMLYRWLVMMRAVLVGYERLALTDSHLSGHQEGAEMLMEGSFSVLLGGRGVREARETGGRGGRGME